MHYGRTVVVEPKENEFDSICICPHCGAKTRWGDMFKICGVNGCPNCHEELNDTIQFDREHHYDAYVRKANNNEYEPYMYRGED